MDLIKNPSIIVLIIASVLVFIVISMYVFWERLKAIHKKRTDVYEDNVKCVTILNRQISMPNPAEALHSVYPSGSVTPPKPARSFSGQFNVKKVSPSARRLAKVNSQIILFNGHPHILSDQVHQRLSRTDIHATPTTAAAAT